MNPWVLYYITLAAHPLVGGYALARGRASQRWAVLIIAGGFALKLAVCAVLSARRLASADYEVFIDAVENTLMGAGFLLLATRYGGERWLSVMVGLLGVEICLDAFVFKDHPGRAHQAFPQVANFVYLAMLGVLGWVTALHRSSLQRAAHTVHA